MGLMKYNSGKIFAGTWRNGYHNGPGKLMCRPSDVGLNLLESVRCENWKDGKADGTVEERYMDGSVVVRQFENSVEISDRKYLGNSVFEYDDFFFDELVAMFDEDE
jgi:hypothetical protein